MRLTADWLIPSWAARRRVLQCVRSAGVSSTVVVMPCSTWASVIVRVAPGRGSACSPSIPRAAKRVRHFVTVIIMTPRRSAMAVFYEIARNWT